MRITYDRNLARSPSLFDVRKSAPENQLLLPISGVESQGIGVILHANRRLRMTPDFDILAWLSHQWATTYPVDSAGWVYFSFHRLSIALSGKTNTGGKGTAHIRASLARLHETRVTLHGYDHESKEQGVVIAEDTAPVIAIRDAAAGQEPGLSPTELGRRWGPKKGQDTVAVQLAPWVCRQLAADGAALLDFALLRKLTGVAKKMWVYLESEKYHRQSGGRREIHPIGLAPPARHALAVGGARDGSEARNQLRRGAERILALDPRYRSIDIVYRGPGSWQLRAELNTKEERVLRERQLESEAKTAAEAAELAARRKAHEEADRNQERKDDLELVRDDDAFYEFEAALERAIAAGEPLADRWRQRLMDLREARAAYTGEYQTGTEHPNQLPLGLENPGLRRVA